ncbi:MAG: hypothetical protein I3273_02305 [Candidatus Moeniiplasma glomeromycotorum]|nr:hypothetical protein [Candidatus Moeniiplasma glomeromycotorum]MCE8167050.1 hypothetical protein [Candidatus Moeniiplasma glomeromycotorum]MCE8168938.1 hypothetical protein [Candidatus Moeniiplasma glomeromycotorum]
MVNENEKTKQEKQQEVIQAINNHFDLNINGSTITLLDEDLMPQGYGIGEIENFAEVIEEIKKYIRNHPQSFTLGGAIYYGVNEGEPDSVRPWWSKYATEDDRGRGRIQGPHGVLALRAICYQGTNEYGQEVTNTLHPNSFTAEQFESIKSCLADDIVCKFPGCFNFYADPFKDNVEFTVRNGRCLYHEIFGEQINEQNNNTHSQETPQVVDNTVIQEYNQQTTRTIQELEGEYIELVNQADEKRAILMSLEKDETPEITTQFNLIYADKQLILGIKEELTGRDDEGRQTQNQQVETINTRAIQEYQEWLQAKKTALTKLTQLVEQVINPPDPQSPENPSTPPPAPNQNKPTNPIVENNQKSEENIKDISQTSSLEEAKQKARQEINDLLDRYGVKSIELTANLWANQTNWETYLKTLTTPEQITDLVKKTKLAIVQKSNQNDRINQKLSPSQLQVKVTEEIKEMLKKHPLIKSADLSVKGQNWEEKLKTLTSQQQILNFARQLRETIVQLDNQQKQKQNFSTSIPLKVAIPVGLGVLGTLAVGIFVIRRRKLHVSKNQNKRK